MLEINKWDKHIRVCISGSLCRTPETLQINYTSIKNNTFYYRFKCT